MAKQGSLDFNRISAITHVGATRGGSQPHRCTCSDGRDYVVKFPSNPQSSRVLINEWIASSLARSLGLSVPDFASVEVSGEFLDSSEHCRFNFGTHRVSPGQCLGFGSAYVGTGESGVYDSIPDSLFPKVENLSDFGGALVLDTLLSNVDGRQCVFTMKKGAGRMYLIDWGFCFNGPHWNDLDSGSYLTGIYSRRAVYATGSAGVMSWVEKVKALKDSAYRQAFQSIPEEWSGPERNALDKLQGDIKKRLRTLERTVAGKLERLPS